MEWYRRQQDAIAAGGTFEESSPSSENMRVNSYFKKAQKTLLFLIRNPKPLIIHFSCWIFGYFLLIAKEYGIPFDVSPPLFNTAG